MKVSFYNEWKVGELLSIFTVELVRVKSSRERIVSLVILGFGVSILWRLK